MKLVALQVSTIVEKSISTQKYYGEPLSGSNVMAFETKPTRSN
jgi:hypothetical protein